MRKIFIIGFLVLLALIVWASTRGDNSAEDPNSLSSEVSNIKVSGEVIDIDMQQAMVDGPYVLVVRQAQGDEVEILVPSMGFQLCAAQASMTHPSEIEVGMNVEASGALASGGGIIPCESPNHYLRVVTP